MNVIYKENKKVSGDIKKKNPSGNLTLTLQSLNLNDMAVSARKIYNLIYFVKGNIPLLVAVEGSSFLQ